MIDALPSEPGKDRVAARRQLHGRLIAGAVAALVVVAGAFFWRTFASPPAAVPGPKVAAAQPARSPVLDQVVKNPALDQLVESVKALEFSQQEAIDQLQVLQQLLAAQRVETKKTTDQVAALSEKFESLRQSFASVPPAAVEADPPPRQKAAPAAHRAHRIVPHKSRTAARRH
jgi:uncharacterized coiled-coil protein SlyX